MNRPFPVLPPARRRQVKECALSRLGLTVGKQARQTLIRRVRKGDTGRWHASDCGHRLGLHAHCAGWRRGAAAAVSEQCDFPRRGRCGGGNAAALGVEHHQPGVGSVPHFRLGAVSSDGRDRSGGGDPYRAQHWRALPVLPAGAGHGADAYRGAQMRLNLAGDAPAHPRGIDGHSAVPDRPGELDRAGAHREHSVRRRWPDTRLGFGSSSSSCCPRGG